MTPSATDPRSGQPSPQRAMGATREMSRVAPTARLIFSRSARQPQALDIFKDFGGVQARVNVGIDRPDDTLGVD